MKKTKIVGRTTPHRETPGPATSDDSTSTKEDERTIPLEQKTTGEIIDDLDAWETHYTRMNRFQKLWWHRGYYIRLPITWPCSRWADIVSFWQRGCHGWSHRDAWNVDHYLAMVIPQMLRSLAATDHSCPPGFGIPTKEQERLTIQEMRGEGSDHDAWKAYLLDLADGFDAYIAAGESEGQYCRGSYEPALAKMRELFDYFIYLWS